LKQNLGATRIIPKKKLFTLAGAKKK